MGSGSGLCLKASFLFFLAKIEKGCHLILDWIKKVIS